MLGHYCNMPLGGMTVTDIQRWSDCTEWPDMREDPEGAYVTYSDHVEAVRQATAQHIYKVESSFATGYEKGQRDALAAAVQRVPSIICNCDDLDWHTDWCNVPRVIAAIKGEGA